MVKYLNGRAYAAVSMPGTGDSIELSISTAIMKHRQLRAARPPINEDKGGLKRTNAHRQGSRAKSIESISAGESLDATASLGYFVIKKAGKC